MNNKLANFRESSRHQSQNDLPPIDKFHPDWWYYRQEVEEPVEIDDNYKNESRHMNKKLIRLTESDLHKIVKEAVNKILTESSIDDVFDGMPHTYTVDLYTRSEGKFGYAFSNIRNYDELNAAIKERFPDVLNWENPRRNKPFNGWH